MIAPDGPRAEVLAASAVSRVSRALVGTGELPVLAAAALEEMRDALDLRLAALYLPDADGLPVLRRYVGDGAAEELSFDEEAWRLAIAGGAPIVLREAASWLVENPFSPPANDWVILPLVTGEREMVGVVIASASEPIRIDPLSGTVLSLLGLQLSAGITTARLRRELLQRRRWSASGARSPPRSTTASRSTSRSRGASSRSRRPTPSACARRSTPPTGSSARACRTSPPTRRPGCARRSRPPRRRSKLAVRVSGHGEAGPEAVTLAARIVSEALANADAHADAHAVEIRFEATDERLDLTSRTTAAASTRRARSASRTATSA